VFEEKFNIQNTRGFKTIMLKKFIAAGIYFVKISGKDAQILVTEKVVFE